MSTLPTTVSGELLMVNGDTDPPAPTTVGDIALYAKGGVWYGRQDGGSPVPLSGQPADQDLTDIAALTPANNDLLQRKAGAWTNRTPGQVILDLPAATTVTQGVMTAVDKSRADNFFNKALWNVLDNGISPANTAAANLAAWDALMAVIGDNAYVFFPPQASSYDFSNVAAIPSGKHLVVGSMPGCNQKAIIRTTHATANIFTAGDWNNIFQGLKFTSSVTRSGGSAILSGNNVGINAYDCDFAGMWDGISYTGGASAGNLANVDRCGFTGTLNRGIFMDGQNANAYINNVTMDGTLGVQQAGIEIKQCGSLIITNSDLIRSVNNLKMNPTDAYPAGVFSVYCANVFFDTASGSSVKMMGIGAIQRVKFTNCWFSGSVIGCEMASTASTLPTAIDFINCDIFGNSGRGILANGVQDFSVSGGCRIAGNGTAGVEVSASAGGVTSFNINGNTIGATAGFGANGTGLLINAGTFKNYVYTGNDFTGNTARVTDNGTAISKKITGPNLGFVLPSAPLTAATLLPLTTVTKCANSLFLPANSLQVGTVIRATAVISKVTATANATATTRLTYNPTDVSTTALATLTFAGSSAAVGAGKVIYEFTVRSIGAGGTATATINLLNNGTTGLANNASVVVIAAAAAINTTVDNFLGIWGSSGVASDHRYEDVFWEVINQ